MTDDTPDAPTPTDTATATAGPIGELPSRFMLDFEMYGRMAQLGYEGLAFYVAGRGGVLGDVDADVVTAGFVFFPATTVRTGWEQAASVESRAASAERFAGACADWARAHLPEDALDYRRLAELAGAVVAAADPAGAPVFAGWRALPEPGGDRESALHRLNALRELRAARHAVAVLAAGLTPVEALMVKTPFMADIFGWPEPRPVVDDALRDRWSAAEARTDELFGRDLAVLDATERAEFTDLAAAALAAAT